ncbi:LamG domain-containing protein [Amycolatopsis sp. NPDC051373]|uniref:LamG domain-containing protein n=1 Tax=Amycolatopsis sp. NPDC051373 TaxID=3155801 RepID=UPI00344F1D13
MALKFAAGMGAGSGATILDDSGGGHPLTVVSGSYTTSGHTGPGFQNVLGTNTTGASGTVAAVTGTACTLMAWVNPSSLPTNGVQLIAGAMQTSGSTDFALWCQRGDFSTHNVLQGDARLGGGVVAANGTALTVGTWVHVALTFDGTNLKLWRDGAVIATVANTGTLSSTTNFVIAGMNISGVSSTGPGVVDDVRYFDSDESANMTTWMNTPVTSSGTVSGAVAFAGKGSVAANGTNATSGAVAMAAFGSVSIPPVVTRSGAAAFAASGGLTASGMDARFAAITMGAAGTVALDGRATAGAAVVFAAVGALSSTTDIITAGGVGLTATGKVTDTGTVQIPGALAILATASTASGGLVEHLGAVALTATAVTAFAAISIGNGAVAIAAAARIAVTSSGSVAGTIPFTAGASLLVRTAEGRDIELVVRPILGRWWISPLDTSSPTANAIPIHMASTTPQRLEETPL